MLLEERQTVVVPSAWSLMLAVSIHYILLFLHLQVVVRGEIGMRRTNRVLQAHRCGNRTGDVRSQVLGVEV